MTLGSQWLRGSGRALEVIGPVADALVTDELLEFRARVDSGAAHTSIHCPESAIRFADPADDPADNVGKQARLELVDDHGRRAEVGVTIHGFGRVRNADAVEPRYEVRLPIRVGAVRRTAVVTLNDRGRMRYKLLLGRDFLRDAFVVDVANDPDEPR